MYCTNCGKEINENAAVCVNCGYAVNNTPSAYNTEDRVSVGLVILAVFIPLFGFIYWPLKHKETPKRAKACGIAAIISFAVSFLLSAIVTPILLRVLSWLLYDANF